MTAFIRTMTASASASASSFRRFIGSHLNFYRIHMTLFVIIPLLTSVVFFYSNGENKISYIDSLFLCYSAATVTGLAAVNLSTLTTWQQVILFLLMFCGSTAAVAIVLIAIRRRFFHEKFSKVIKENAAAAAAEKKRQRRLSSSGRTRSIFSFARSFTGAAPRASRTITRVDSPAKVNSLNPSGGVHSRSNTPIPDQILNDSDSKVGTMLSPEQLEKQLDSESIAPVQQTPPAAHAIPLVHFPMDEKAMLQHQHTSISLPPLHSASLLPPPSPKSPSSHLHSLPPLPQSPSIMTSGERGTVTGTNFARSMSIDIREPTGIRLDRDRNYTRDSHMSHGRTSVYANSAAPKLRNKHKSFGGFPSPLTIALRLMKFVSPKASDTLKRATTMPYDNTGAISLSRYGTTSSFVNNSNSLSQYHSSAGDLEQSNNPNDVGSALLGRNSMFHGLSREEADQLGGVEYIALHMLAIIILGYYFGLILLGVVIVAPYCSFTWVSEVVNKQPGVLAPSWFGIFDVVSAFSNSGLSLVDSSLTELQTAYPLILVLIFLILAGNTAYPIFLRLFIWIAYRLAPANSQTKQTLSFILDHPRRCFIYLFPSVQTWFLLAVLVSMMLTDWVSFLVLDIGNGAIESIPVGTRILAGFLQSAAVRAAGFGIVSLSALAPAVQVLYLIMMYISVYPIAMSVRATNVYEERSLGVFEEEPSDEEPQNLQGSKRKVWGAYLGWHLRRQLAFDVWSLAFALWLICIIERGAINDETKPYLNIFSILFEVVSAYGTVGLSLGLPFDFYSLSGDFTVLSKLVICVVMIRGRHRGLPIAVDRAILLPSEVAHVDQEEDKVRSDFGTTSVSSQARHSRMMTQARSFAVTDDSGSLHDRSSLQDDNQSFGLHRRGLNRSLTEGPQSPKLNLHPNLLPALEEVKEGVSRNASTSSLTVHSKLEEPKPQADTT